MARTIAQWQALAAQWTDSRFPDDDLSQRGLVLGEETGEVLRCILKARQNIRGGTDKWLAELPGEIADVFFCLAALAHRGGIDLNKAINDRWLDLEQRTYTRESGPVDPTGYTLPSGEISTAGDVASGDVGTRASGSAS